MKVEQLSNKDQEGIINLILPIQQQENNVPVTLEDQPDLLNIESFYFRNAGGFWGIKKEDEIVGTIALLAENTEFGTIRKMFVKKELRGKEYGIAQHLLNFLIDYCRSKQINHLYLGTFHVLVPAMRFYEKNGFERIDPTDLPKNFPRMKVDDVFYHRSITPAV